jgi:hypothetical protein
MTQRRMNEPKIYSGGIIMKYENKLDIVRKFRMTPVFQN